jgi:trans-aconitate 2-methyltransferase
MNTGPREWDADIYHRVSDHQLDWGLEVLDRLPLDGDETVLDAGCGSGRVTAALVERLPRGRVIGVDGSTAMVEKARETLGDRVEVFEMDLTELELDQPVDAVFSNAVFHWITDHDLLFRRIHSVLRPGGRLIAQCGGRGNVASLAEVIAVVGAEQPFSTALEGLPAMWNFATAEETEEKLRAAGFGDVRSWPEPKTVTPEDPLGFLRTATLGPFLDRLPEPDREPFARRVAEGMGEPLTLDYVRLNIDARRPA